MKKQEQLSLFPEPEFRCQDRLTREIKETLEDIALTACQKPLLFGEDSYSLRCQRENTLPEKRFALILGYMESESNAQLYLIQYDKKIIGAAYVSAGWIPEEADYVDPNIELAFLNPAYKEHIPLIRRKSIDILEEVI
ncbi:hypothetical protein HYV87_03780 [Candidatus Woesearchaeota archaeon]|nr:hypothetical protein [Candidatus Woesearchaeota archaeon]